VVICLEQGAKNLLMVKLMPLPPHHLIKIQNGLPFWCRVTHIVLEKAIPKIIPVTVTKNHKCETEKKTITAL